jgi:eukaryotic-like serine/threonine-protein kinase
VSASASSAVLAGDAQANAASRVGGRYLLLDRLRSGGMGVVYRARDEASGKVVALKQLISARAGSKRRTVEALFEREYHILLRLKHPRIIEVYDYGFTETGPYYTMELLEGSDLSQLGRLPYREACRHARDVASSLALIHAQRIIRSASSRSSRRVLATPPKRCGSWMVSWPSTERRTHRC